MFDPTKKDLETILKDIDKGNLQLPDFQRDYVWGDEDTRSLIASVAKGFPIGALLTLETGGEVNFKPRLLQGVPERDADPEQLLLDGQQRMTSLYQTLWSDKPLQTINEHKKAIERYYYIDIERSVAGSADLMDAIIGVPADRILRRNFGRNIALDLSSREKEFEANMFPLNQVFNAHDWLYPWSTFWDQRNSPVGSLQKDFYENVVKLIEKYNVPIICLDKTNSREAICLVFEKVNVGGKKLDAFELVTAIYAADGFDLREDWKGVPGNGQLSRQARLYGYPNRRDVLKEVASTDFLQACTVISTRNNRIEKERQGAKDKELPKISCTRESLLQLPLEDYRRYADAVETGFIRASELLNEWKIIWHRDVPYPPLIVALATVFAILGERANTAAVKAKLEQWFWSVSLGELYGSSTESRIARDVPDLVSWVDGGPQPRSLDEAIFQEDRLDSLRIRLSAAYKAVHALLMHNGCRDFVSGKSVDIMTFFNNRIDIHHIFPKDWCKKQGIDQKIYNSIINKTALSARTNRKIGGKAPSEYLAAIEKEDSLSRSELDAILRSHQIEPEFLRADDFNAFYQARKEALSSMIEQAMGKAVVRGGGQNETEIELDSVFDVSLIEEEQFAG